MVRILSGFVSAFAAMGLVIAIGLGWLFWPISQQTYDWQETVSELIDNGECQSAMRLLVRLGMTDTDPAYDVWRTVRLETGCGSGLLGVDPTKPLDSDEEFFVRFIEERTWPRRREPFENLYTRPFPNRMPSVREMVFHQRCGRTILSRSMSNEFAVREQVMEMELDTDLLKPWERRIRSCANLAYRIAESTLNRAAFANSRDVWPLVRYGLALANWASGQDHPGAIRLTAEYTINRVSLFRFNHCTEQIEASLPGEFWWARENLQPFLEANGQAQRLYAELWESGVLAPPNNELAYYWFLRASESGEPVGLALFRLQRELGFNAADLLEERMVAGERPEEPRISFPMPTIIPDCDGN